MYMKPCVLFQLYEKVCIYWSILVLFNRGNMCYCSSRLFDCYLVAVIWNYMLSGLQLNLSVLLEIWSGVHLVLIRLNSLRSSSASNTVFLLHFIYTSFIWLTHAVQNIISLLCVYSTLLANVQLACTRHSRACTSPFLQISFPSSQPPACTGAWFYLSTSDFICVFCVMLGLPAFNSNLAGVEDA